ncbi:acyl-CoA dehydrogenase family protein [Pseudonocardia sp. MH-G8]|uniref:acyl-CoA dehydrogenase family protein n=1 Tax=Pseudonocardia sp. MH-G8 TaxID=1854588 RepID=UPI000BA16C08|nr:acyl-CoA dehydrogenase family protein [Pseudonocardia sp. MH-G8]OZM81330.1 acyl-CoA dehydrogenase [Pseudonocardia sp. MH-G8]
MTTAPETIGRTGGSDQQADLITAARGLQPLLRENAAAGEAAGQLTAPVVDALHDAGLFGMWVPAPLGGAELDPVSSLEVVQALAEADPSAAWVTMAAALATGTGGAYLGDEAVAELFGGPRFPVVAGQGTRPGRAVRDDGGYRLSGSWGFASGIKHASWIHTLAVVEETGDPLIFVLPVGKADLADNWDVLGLAATGSIDYTIDDVHVPAAFTHLGPTETPVRGGALFTLGIMHLALIGHSGWALGVSRRMLDDLAQLVRAKAGRPGTMADNPRFQAVYGEAEARWHAARAFVHETWRAVGATIASGAALDVEQKTMARLALYHATWTAEEISVAVYRAGGTTALRSGALQQYFRDMHAGTQHVTSAPGVIEACGRSLGGLAPGHDWLYMNLVPPKE